MQAQQREYASSDGYDLFRRAIVDRDEDAWAETATRYRPLLAAWASRCSASPTLAERFDDLADQALARAWAALSPARFASFPNLAALMAYLRACVTSTVIDYVRTEQSRARIEQAIEVDAPATPEQIVLGQFERQEVWRIAERVIATEQERVALRESFMYDLRPSAILQRHPDLFGDVSEVYAAKRNLFDRLKRCDDLRQLYKNWSEQ